MTKPLSVEALKDLEAPISLHYVVQDMEKENGGPIELPPNEWSQGFVLSHPELRAHWSTLVHEDFLVPCPFPKALQRLNLRESDLRACDLHGVNLTGSDFTGSRLCDASASACVAHGADFTRSDLSNANFAFLVAEGIKFSRSDMGGTNLSYAEIPKANFHGADLRNCNFYYARADGAIFGSLYSSAVIQHACLKGAQMADACWMNSTFKSVDFRDVLAAGMSSNFSHFWRGTFKGANLRNARLLGSHFTGTEFVASDLTDSHSEACHFTSVDFEKACLLNATFKGCVFTDCDFSKTKLIRAKFTDCVFIRCALEKYDFLRVAKEPGNVMI